MSTPVLSQTQLYDIFKNAVTDEAPDLTDWNDGSELDTLGGAFSTGGVELLKYVVDQFRKTFFNLAQGSDENGGGDDDLQTLAVDRFGQSFARPGAVAAVDTITFSRPTDAKGVITILSGTIVKTKPDANGQVQRYSTNSTVILTASSVSSDLSVSVGITAQVAGAAGSANAGTINVIESSLLDTTITCSNAGNSTGADAQDSATYRETIRNLIEALAGATATAVAAKAKTVAGIVNATPIETGMTVIQWNGSTTVGSSFRIPIATLYIADSTGSASPTLVTEVKAAINSVRACGVNINVIGATPVSVNWSAALTLNPSGPNYATLVNDTSAIVQSMEDYINGLPTGTGFVRSTANAAILAIWGPSGTNDLTAMTTSVPSGDVAATANDKMVAGTVQTI